MLTPTYDSAELPFSELVEAVHQALRDIQNNSADHSPLQSLALFHETTIDNQIDDARQVINLILRDALHDLAHSDGDHAKVVQLRFFDGLPVHQVASDLNIAESTTYLYQREGISSLAAIINARDNQARSEARERLTDRLPLPTYAELVGVDSILADLLGLLANEDVPWLVSLEGIGGIGKTTIADALIRKVIHSGLFPEIGWVSAQSSQMSLAGEIRLFENAQVNPQLILRRILEQLIPDIARSGGLTDGSVHELLRTRLKETPHLIVVDNLETVADLQKLLPTLQTLTNPSKFLLTTRESLFGEPHVFPYSVQELDQPHALQLIRHEATIKNIPGLESVEDSDLKPIYTVVGGNPLALRLIVGQLHVHPLPVVLDGLRDASGLLADNLYTFIYWKAWNSLDEVCRRVLLSMPLLAPEGDSLQFLAQITGLDIGELSAAAQKLVELSLVESRGDLSNRRYSIHSLTRTFLMEQVAKWN